MLLLYLFELLLLLYLFGILVIIIACLPWRFEQTIMVSTGRILMALVISVTNGWIVGKFASFFFFLYLSSLTLFKKLKLQILSCKYFSITFQNTGTALWVCETPVIFLILTLKLTLRELQSSNKNRALWAVYSSSINPHNVNHEVSTLLTANKPDLYYITPQQAPAIFSSFIELGAVWV